MVSVPSSRSPRIEKGTLRSIPSSRASSSTRHVGTVSEPAYIDDPKAQQERFIKILVQAIQIRRYYLKQRLKGICGQIPYKVEDLPPASVLAKVDPPALNLGAIFNSFHFNLKKQDPKTTGADPAKRAAQLQAAVLVSEHPPVWLEGRQLTFHRIESAGIIRYAPRHLFRSGHEWMLKVPHCKGWFSDSVPDAEYEGDPAPKLRSRLAIPDISL